MEVTSFSRYCENFLSNPDLGSKTFFQDSFNHYTYRDLINSALCRYNYFKHSPDVFFALQIQSPYLLFTNLLGAIFAQKNVLILSNKEPANSVARLQENIPFTQVIKDHEPETPHQILEFPLLEINTNRPAFFILSSGSSGPRKGIPLSLENIFLSSMSVVDFFKMNSEDTSFSNLSPHHIGGLMIYWRAFFSMGRVTTDNTQKYQFISLVPLQLQRYLSDKNKTHELKNCRGVLIGGSPLETSLKRAAMDHSIPVFETYGMSETCSLVMLNGRPLKGQEVKLDNEGHFLIKGKTLTNNAILDEDGFYHTKDVGTLNPDGSFSFKHRGDLLFKSGGELINPQAIEAKTKELSWITEAVVVPVKHHEWTDAAVMIYKSSDSSKNSSELRDYLKTHFHPHLVPKFFIEAPKDLLQEGIKPQRFEISKFAQTQYFKNIFHHLYIPNANSKRLMVFFHGFMEDHTDMIPLMDNHRETSYLFIDLPGHGKSKTENFKSRTSVFAELYSMIRFYNFENSLVLYGYSMGGRIALELTLMGLEPEKLILESAHFGLKNPEEKSNRLSSDKKLLAHAEDLATFFEEWYKNPIFSGYNKSSHYKIDLEKKLTHNSSEWQTSLEFFSPGHFPYDLKNVISKLATQNIIGIVGLEDIKYKKHYEEMRNNLECISLYEVENCGHNPHKTHVSEVKKILSLID